jgi:hypothetical protein
MKAKLGGLGGIKHFFVAHGEKLGIAVVAIIALGMIYKAMGREGLPAEKAASKLNEQITQARQSIEECSWEKMKAEFPTDIRELKPIQQTGASTVKPPDYVGEHYNIAWDRGVVPPIVLRTDPVLLEPQRVEVNGGAGLLAFVDPAVRRAKLLEERRKADELAKKTAEDAAALAEGAERGGRGTDPTMDGTMFDPAHPKRRPVVGMSRPAGVPLQDYEEVRVAHWAVVLAKVPIKEQLKLYRDALENARGYSPAADIPQVLGYFVERAEVHSGDEDKELTWTPVSVYNGRGERLGGAVTAATLFGKQSTADQAPTGVTAKWVAQMPEIADPRYLDGSILAFPLPPLVGRDWGSEVVHSEVPLAADAVPEDPTKQPETEKKPGATDEPVDEFAGGAVPGGGMAGGRGGVPGGGYGMGGGMSMEGGGRGGYGGMPGGGYGGGMRGGMGAGMGGGYGMGMGGGRDEGGYGGGYSGGGGGGFGADGEPLAPHWMLRFFDFSVESGKKYKYRVRLAILDPNQSYGPRRVETEYLDSAVIARVKKDKAGKAKTATPFRLTEWSAPSRTVTIPLAGSVNVAGAKPAPDPINGEPKAALLVQSFSTDEKNNAIQAAKEKDLQRGAVANMIEDTEILVDQGRAIDPYKAFKFQTDITVADIRGGERLTRDESRPARVLLMGPGGQLFVQDQTTDAEVVEAHRAAFAKEAPGGGGFDGGFGGGRGGAPGYGGRE